MTSTLSEDVTDTFDPSGISPPDGTFARFRFAGGRFDSHAIPLEVLPDLAAYKTLIVEVAKMLFKQRMGARERVPKGFEDSFQIGLARVEGGHSAVAIMPRLDFSSVPVQQQQLQLAANQPQFSYPDFDDARAYVDDLVLVVGTLGVVPAHFPTELAGFFNSFGQSLRDDEFIEMGFRENAPVRYDTSIRKKIVLSRENTYENSVDAQFTLNGGDVALGVIHVLDITGAPFDFQPPTEFEFKKAYNRPNEAVQLVGTALYDKNERLRRLVSVNVIYSQGGAAQPFGSRLEEIGATPAGWHDGDNPAPLPAAIAAMGRFLESVSLEPVPQPYLYPLPEGGVAAEWSLEPWEASAEIDAQGASIALHAVNTESLEELDAVYDLESNDVRDGFMRFMTVMLAGNGVRNADQ